MCIRDRIRTQVFEFYMQVGDFLNTYDRVDENYEIYTEHMENGNFQLKLFCIHTARNLKAVSYTHLAVFV